MIKKKKLLILNGSHSEIPLIKSSKSLDFYVITTGNNPELIGHQYSDEYCFADYSDLETVLEVARNLNVDAVCSCSNDFGIMTASYISEKLGLPGHDAYETTKILHQKDLFKKFSMANDIPTPYAEGFDDIDKALAAINKRRFPLIIKPIDLSGGKGVSVVRSAKECPGAIQTAFSLSHSRRIVIEDFIKGSQHSFSTFIVNGRVVFYFSDNEYSYLNPFFVSTSAAPAVNVSEVADDLIQNIEKISKMLSLKDGIFHIQYLYSGKKAYILEITRRCSGDLYPSPVDYSTGLDWAGWIVRAEAGMDCSGFPAVSQKGFCGRHCIMSPKNGIIKNVIIDKQIEGNIYDKLIWLRKSYRINNYLTDKAGVVLLKYDSMDEMLDKTARIHQLIYMNVE
ncbi:MAG: ATP-grasp domain-containing protein [Syntrophaceae bacterium]|nr:ATP-grasp domain-containing protein [Syntrophaceae bacterium]